MPAVDARRARRRSGRSSPVWLGRRRGSSTAPADHVEPGGFGSVEPFVGQVGLMHDPSQVPQQRISNPKGWSIVSKLHRSAWWPSSTPRMSNAVASPGTSSGSSTKTNRCGSTCRGSTRRTRRDRHGNDVVSPTSSRRRLRLRQRRLHCRGRVRSVAEEVGARPLQLAAQPSDRPGDRGRWHDAAGFVTDRDVLLGDAPAI